MFAVVWRSIYAWIVCMCRLHSTPVSQKEAVGDDVPDTEQSVLVRHDRHYCHSEESDKITQTGRHKQKTSVCSSYI